MSIIHLILHKLSSFEAILALKLFIIRTLSVFYQIISISIKFCRISTTLCECMAYTRING